MVPGPVFIYRIWPEVPQLQETGLQAQNHSLCQAQQELGFKPQAQDQQKQNWASSPKTQGPQAQVQVQAQLQQNKALGTKIGHEGTDGTWRSVPRPPAPHIADIFKLNNFSKRLQSYQTPQVGSPKSTIATP